MTKYRYYKYVDIDVWIKVPQKELDTVQCGIIEHTEAIILLDNNPRITNPMPILEEKLYRFYFETTKDLYEEAKLRIHNLIEKEI